ncbi:MAG: DUF4238 domain-containing protein [Saprospiraceae bacterium]|nr:DUF4238 domain-containing protein [Saprospiraceae bacterium]
MRKKHQHIIPQVYLRQFGFTKFRNEWFVSVKNQKNGKWEDREVRRFLVGKEFYTLSVYRNISDLILENDLNGKIENRLPKIIDYLNYIASGDKIHRAIHMDIAETTANFLCRSELVINWLKGWYTRSDVRFFFDMITDGQFEGEISNDHIFNVTMSFQEKDKTLTLMVFLMQHIKLILCNAKMTIFRNQSDFHLLTSNNPVNLVNVGIGDLPNPNMEIYFPLSKDYLIYFYWDSSITIVETIKPILQNDTVHDLNEDLYTHFTLNILASFADKFIILPTDKSNLGR